MEISQSSINNDYRLATVNRGSFLEQDDMDDIRRDPVCGMIVLPDKGFTVPYEGETIYFCSEYCKARFQEHPKRYLAEAIAITHEEARANRRIAYFSMEVAINPAIPTYSGDSACWPEIL